MMDLEREPASVFMRGGNPEWSPPHFEYHRTREEHQAFHEKLRSEHERWHQVRTNRNPEGEQFRLDHRAFHEVLNGFHRESHRFNALMKRAESGVGQSLGPVEGGVQRTVSVQRWSRRTLERLTREKQAHDAMMRGK
jgi:hypothetical protein